MVVNQRRKELSLNTVINGQRQAINTKRAAQFAALARFRRAINLKKIILSREFLRVNPCVCLAYVIVHKATCKADFKAEIAFCKDSHKAAESNPAQMKGNNA